MLVSLLLTVGIAKPKIKANRSTDFPEIPVPRLLTWNRQIPLRRSAFV